MAVTVKLLLLKTSPNEVVIITAPVAAPGITRPTNCVPEFDITTASLPPISKPVKLPKLVPVIVIKVPTGPDAGLNEVIVGGAMLLFETLLLTGVRAYALWVNIPAIKKKNSSSLFKEGIGL